MIDYLKAARRLRRIVATLKDKDPELSRLADILERLGRKTEHPMTQIFREAGKIMRDLDLSPGLETFFQDVLSDEPKKEAAPESLQNDVQILHNSCEDLKRKLDAVTQERDAWHTAYLAVKSQQAPDDFKALVFRYCASVIDPGSTPVSERLELFQKLLQAAQG